MNTVDGRFARTELLLGERAMQRLADSRVAIFGVGGVGSACAEALIRSGVGAIDLIDPDRVVTSNLNRQLMATTNTIGAYKADAMAERLLLINPEARVNVLRLFFLPADADTVDFSVFDYVVDAVDTVSAKIAIAERAIASGAGIISAMGTGNKLDPQRLRVADIYETKVCPLARVMRKELRKRGIEKLRVVFSDEPPISLPGKAEDESAEIFGEAEVYGSATRSIPGSVPFVPASAGFLLAAEVVKALIRDDTG